MEFIPIIHRVNNTNKLSTIPTEYGVEIDIRIENNNLYLSHDPIKNINNKTQLEEFLSEFHHSFIVANIKDTGIERRVIEQILEKTENFFLLDYEIPFLFNKNKEIKPFLCARFSKFEEISNDSLILDYVDWLWVDSFESLPINSENIKNLPNLKKCLVSPERFGREEDIFKIATFMKSNNFNFDLIMTDLSTVDIWNAFLKI